MPKYGRGLKTSGHLRTNHCKRSRRNKIQSGRNVLILRRVLPDYDFSFIAQQHLHNQVLSSKATKVDDVHTAKENEVVDNTSSMSSEISDMKCFFFRIIPAICYVTP